GRVVVSPRPWAPPRRQLLFSTPGKKLAQQTTPSAPPRSRSPLQYSARARRPLPPQARHNVREQLAIFAETTIGETVRHVVESRLRHQRQDVEHAIRDLSRPHRIFDEFGQAILGSDPLS